MLSSLISVVAALAYHDPLEKDARRLGPCGCGA